MNMLSDLIFEKVFKNKATNDNINQMLKVLKTSESKEEVEVCLNYIYMLYLGATQNYK